MSKQVTLEAQKRTATGTSAAKRTRRDGQVPGVVYGAQQDEYPIQVSAKEFGDLLRHSASENFLVNLQIEGAKEASKLALVQAVQHHPINNQILHIDFNAVREDTEIHANIPLHLTGDSPGVKSGGVLEQQHHELEIHCLPANLPEEVSVDIGELEMGDSLHVSDIVFPEGVSPTLEGDVIVVLVSEPRVSAADEEAAAAPEGEAAEGDKKEGDEAPAADAS